MNAKQLERASYLAAYAVLAADVSPTHLAAPGARRTYIIDSIANKIRSVFELHCSAFDDSSDWEAPNFSPLPLPGEACEDISPVAVGSKVNW